MHPTQSGTSVGSSPRAGRRHGHKPPRRFLTRSGRSHQNRNHIGNNHRSRGQTVSVGPHIDPHGLEPAGIDPARANPNRISRLGIYRPRRELWDETNTRMVATPAGFEAAAYRLGTRRKRDEKRSWIKALYRRQASRIPKRHRIPLLYRPSSVYRTGSSFAIGRTSRR